MIYTIGHSNHSIEHFLTLLQQHEIAAVVDVRSAPYSRFNPQYNREALKQSLANKGVDYIFLGEELGARSKDEACYEHGRVSYRKLAATPQFHRGLERVLAESGMQKIALMCAEKEPLDCHRTILVARELVNHGAQVAHILADGSMEPHEAAITRLRTQLKLPDEDFFRSAEELAQEAYELQSQRIAYTR